MAEQELDPRELSKQLMKPTGEVGRKVAQTMNEFNHSLYELAWQMLDLNLVNRVLEIGFGNGKHISYYFEQNPDIVVTGVDFSEDMCEAARQNNVKAIKEGRLHIHCADSASIPQDDGSFDLILALNTVFFWNPPEPHFDEFYRVLKSGGHLLIGYRPRSTMENMPFSKQIFTLYDPEGLRNLLDANKFRVADEKFNTFEVAIDEDSGDTFEVTNACLIAERVS